MRDVVHQHCNEIVSSLSSQSLCPAVYHDILEFSARVLVTDGIEFLNEKKGDRRDWHCRSEGVVCAEVRPAAQGVSKSLAGA